MSAQHSKEASVARWLRNNESFTNNFVVEWVREHPDLLDGRVGHQEPKHVDLRDHSAKQRKRLKGQLSSCTSDLVHYHRRDASQLQEMGKDALYTELLKDVLTADFNLEHLSIKIAKNVLLLCKGTECSVFFVDKDSIVPHALNVTSANISKHQEFGLQLGKCKPLNISMGQGIVGSVVKSGKAVRSDDPAMHTCYEIAVDQGKINCPFLCVPIKAPDGHVVGAIQVSNHSKSLLFSEEDVKILEEYLSFTSVAIINTGLFEQTLWRARKLENILGLAQGLFEDTTSLKSFVYKVMTEAQQLLPCEVCRILLVDDDPPGACAVLEFTKGFELFGGYNDDGEVNEMTELTIHDNMTQIELATSVAMSGKAVATLSGLESEVSIEIGGNPCGEILCVPILDLNSQSVGVAQLFHKLSGNPFNQGEIESFEIFAMFCGLGIHNVLTYEKLQKTSAKKEVAMDLLSYHASAPEEEVERLWFRSLPSLTTIHLDSYYFDDLLLDDDTTVTGAVKMFYELGLVDRFHINQKILLRWVLTVRKNYRPVTYHNWRHAFNVAQTMFTVITTGLMSDHLTKLEQFALLIAAFCHDLDHRGTNNAFMAKSESPLAQLYSTSTMEHHHLDQCLMIFNSEKNNILHGVTSDEYAILLDMIESAILSTDLALYFKKKDEFDELIYGRSFDWTDGQHMRTLRAMMMTACDVAAIAKPWPVQKRVAELVAGEFFEQGDKERTDLQLEPAAMMDRHRRHELPSMQLGFIDNICCPLYQVLTSMHASFEPMFNQLSENRDEWENLAEVAEKESMEIAAALSEKEQNQKVVSAKQAKHAKKQEKKEKAAAKKAAKKAAKDRKKSAKKARKGSTGAGLKSSHTDSRMSIQSVSSSSLSFSTGSGESEEGARRKRSSKQNKKCLLRPFAFLRKVFVRKNSRVQGI